MGNTIMGAVVSLDGYIADTNGDVGGDQHVDVAAGEIGWQALRMGLTNQVIMNLGPVLLGAGHPFFGNMGSGDVVTLANPSRVVQGDRVAHLLYDVERTEFQGEAARC
jgi:hypothetical protein